MTNEPLWRRIKEFIIDDPDAVQKFSDRLAAENDWSKSYALRVVEEYRRFVYLCMVANRIVTPSDEVDQAWHLHLVYTRSYWDGLCKGVLGRPLHHGPTKGGEEEDDRYEEAYESTKALYTEEFGCSPDEDIWPPSDERFSVRSRRVSLSKNWVIPKRPVMAFGRIFMVMIFAASGVMAMSVAWKAFWWIIGILGVILILYFIFRRPRGGGSGCSSGTSAGCGFWFFSSCSSGCSSSSSGCSSSGCGSSGCGGGGCSSS